MKRDKLVNEVMTMLLAGNGKIAKNLQQQFNRASYSIEENTNAGFYVKFITGNSVLKLDSDVTFNFGDVIGNTAAGNSFGFVLFIEHGRIKMLEGYSYAADFPSEGGLVELKYDQIEPHDVEKVFENAVAASDNASKKKKFFGLF